MWYQEWYFSFFVQTPEELEDDSDFEQEGLWRP